MYHFVYSLNRMGEQKSTNEYNSQSFFEWETTAWKLVYICNSDTDMHYGQLKFELVIHSMLHSDLSPPLQTYVV